MMKSFTRLVLAAALLAPASVFAAPITISFTVTATTSYGGFAPGEMGGGFVTVDDSIGNGADLQNGLPTLDLEFDWLGFHYTEADARLWEFGLDLAGDVAYWGIGPLAPNRPDCGLNCYSYPGPTDFWVVGTNPIYGDTGNSHFHIEDLWGAMVGTVEWSVAPAQVPEPATLAMFGFGLLGIAASRRKRKV